MENVQIFIRVSFDLFIAEGSLPFRVFGGVPSFRAAFDKSQGHFRAFVDIFLKLHNGIDREE